MSIIMPYSDSLQNLSFWYRQLWAESIGDGKGLTPINSLGTVDQHSQLQLYLGGPRDKFFTIIGERKRKKVQKLIAALKEQNLHKSSQKVFRHFA